jgi:hypothetical protein
MKCYGWRAIVTMQNDRLAPEISPTIGATIGAEFGYGLRTRATMRTGLNVLSDECLMNN